jgi:sugar phosphate isomerase/epimerase
MNNKIIVFTKPWKEQSIEELAVLVKEMGFDGVELPVREGYQVTPDNVGEKLMNAKKVFEKHGLFIGSIAGSLEKETIEAMGKANVPVLRICVKIDMSKGYFESVKETQKQINDLQDVLEKNHVKVGIQNHHGNMVGSALGIHHLLSGVSPKVAGATLDFAHCGLDGEPTDMAFDIVKDNIILINFKGAYKMRTNGPDEEQATWQIHWATARHALYSWKDTVDILRENNWTGNICMPAEYNHIGSKDPIMGEETIGRTVQDLKYLRTLLED